MRAELAKATDLTWRIGLINSLGERRDAEAVPLIAKQLDDEKAVTAAASTGVAQPPNSATIETTGSISSHFAPQTARPASRRLKRCSSAGASVSIRP